MKNNRRGIAKVRGGGQPQSIQQLDCISQALTQAYRSFNSASDPLVMDACIFEINALRARRNSILRELRRAEQSGPEYNSSS